MSLSLNNVLAFDGTNYGYQKARMRFFLKSIDYWKIAETGWTKPSDATPEAITEKTHDLPMIKPSMLYVKHSHRLNS
jgi:hypothetical protein